MKRAKLFFILVLSASLMAGTVSCKKEKAVEEKPAEKAMTVQNVAGEVTVLSGGVESAADLGVVLKKGDLIATKKASIVDIVYADTVLIRINENSKLTVQSIMDDVTKETALELEKGKIYSTLGKLKKDSSFSVKTPTTVVAVRGTSFRITADAKKARAEVVEGKVEIQPIVGGKVVEDVKQVVETSQAVELDAKQAAKAAKEKKPIAVVKMEKKQIEEIKSEVRTIRAEVVDRLNLDLRREIRVNIMEMKKDKFLEEEKMRLEREKKWKEKLRLLKERRGRDLKEKPENETAEKEKKEERDKPEKGKRLKERVADRVARERKDRDDRENVERDKKQKEEQARRMSEKIQKERERLSQEKKAQEKKERDRSGVPSL